MGQGMKNSTGMNATAPPDMLNVLTALFSDMKTNLTADDRKKMGQLFPQLDSVFESS